MDYTEVTIACENLEPIIGLLYSLDICGLVIKDKNDFKDLLAHKGSAWDYIDDDLIHKENMQNSCVQFYLEPGDEGIHTLTIVKEKITDFQKENPDFEPITITTSLFREEDWANNWKQYFKPYEIGDTIVIKPEWETYDNTQNRIVIEIDPGAAFGTGTHETTKMCIEALASYIPKQRAKTMLDIGTGSGILSIAGAKLGIETVQAIDIEEGAVKVAKENVTKSGLQNQITVKKGDLVTDVCDTFDVIAANIIADVIISLAESIKNFMNDHSIFIASGIIDTKKDEVKNAFEKNKLTILEEKQNGDWFCFVCKK